MPTYTEDTPLLLSGIAVSDADGTTVTVTLTLSNIAAGSLSTATSGAVTSTYNAATGVWRASGALADVNALLAGVTYNPATNFNGSFTIATGVIGGVAPAITGNQVMTGIAVNDAPTATNLDTAETYAVNTTLNLVNIVVNDVDSSNITATLTLSNIAAGRLTASNSGGGASSTYNATTGVWRVSGSIADVNNRLASVSFVPTAGFNGSFFVATSVTDGTATVTGSKAFAIAGANAAPAATNLNAAETYVEDTALNLINIVVSDADSASVSATLTLSNTAAGSLSTATSGAVTSTYNAATGVWTASGALADVNALLAGVTFNPTANFNGNFTVATRVSDGVAPALTGSKAFTGTAVNDAPTPTNLNAAETYTVNTALNLTDIVVDDVDSANVTVTLTLSNAAAGSLSTATVGGVTSTYNAATGVWSASGATASVNTLLAGLTFSPAVNFSGSFSIITSVSDGTSTVTGSKLFTGLVPNNAPTAINLSAAENYTEDTVLDLTDIVVSDADGDNITAVLTLSNAAAGSLSTATADAVTSTYNAATGVWSASGALASVNTLLAGVIFTPTADFNGSFNIATSVSDGVAPAVTGSKLFSGVAVNDAPTALNLDAAETYTEDTPLNLAGIAASDIDSASISAMLTLSNAAAGSLSTATAGSVTSTYNAATGEWTASGALADVNALLAGVTFNPAADFNGSFSIATSVSDGTAAISGHKTVSGIAVNDAPLATNLDFAETYIEDTALNLAAIVVSDVDSANVAATLTLSDIAAGSLSTGTAGAVTSTYNAATGVWTASGALADVNTLLAGITFNPAADFNGSFSIATSISDGAIIISGNKAVSGIAVNDAPTAANLDAAETYTEDTALNLDGIVISDIDSANVSATLTLSDAAVGSLTTATAGAVTSTYDAATGVWAASGALAEVNTLLAGIIFNPAADFNGSFGIATSVSDGVATIGGNKLVNGVAVNDAPTVANLSAAETYTEDSPLNLTDIVISDIDSANVSATLTLSDTAAGILSTGTAGAVTSTYNAATGVWTASGALADVNTLLVGVSFNPSANFNGSFAIAASVSDGTATITGSKTVTGTAVNDAPTATNLNAAEVYTVNTARNLDDIVVSDIDSASVTATLTLSNTAAGSLSTATAGAVTSTYNAATGVWSASGAVASVNTLLSGVTFNPALNFSGGFAVATSISDGEAPALTGSKAFTSAGLNVAPTATNLNAAETYTEDLALNLTDIVVSDVDSANVSATLTLSNTAAGSLSTATAGAVTSTYNAATGVWTASGALADVNALLAGVTFNPAANFNGSFTVATRVSDGVAPALTGSKAFTGIALTEPPVATNLNAPETYTEDTARNLTDIVVSDVDSTNVSVTLTLSNPAAGSLSTSSTGGGVTSTYNAATGVWSVSGRIDRVNTLLAGVTFNPAANFNDSFTIATRVSDGTAAVTGSKAFTGIAVNDLPAATNLSAAESYTEDTARNLTDIVVTDVDGGNITATLTLSNLAAGSLSTATAGAVTSSYNAATGVWAASGALADVNALLAGVTFNPAANFNGSFTIATGVSDGVAPALTGSKAFTGTAVNDAPTATNLSAAQTYASNTALNLTDIVVSDVDSANVTVTLTLSNPAAGSLNTATAGAVTSTYNAATGVWSASGALASVNTLLAGVTFNPAANFNGSFTIVTSVSDGVAPAITGSKAISGSGGNAAPAATNLNAAETYTEDTALNLTDIVVSDIDSANVTATLTLSNTAAGSLSTATAGAVTSTYNAATGVWTASGALASVNTLLAGVTFNPVANFNGSFAIATSVSDGTTTLTGSKAVTGTAVNDAPAATSLNAAEAYTEDTVLNLADIVVSDIDSVNVTATLTLSNTAAGNLSTATAGAVTSTYNAATGVWSASGALASVNTLLAGVTFNPAANFNGSFTIATSVSDGTTTLTGSKAVTGTAVNDAPAATNLNAAESYTEDTARNLTDIVVSDVDSANVTATLTLSNAAAGSLSTATASTVTSTYNGATGVWSASGALASVNTLLAGVTFNPAANFNGSFNIATSVSDGVAPAITGSKSVTGVAVNDAPTATNLSAADTYNQGVALNLTDIVVSDIDSANVTATLTLSNIAAGSLSTATAGAVTSTYNSATGVWSASGALASVNTLLAGVTFNPAVNFSSNFTIATSVSDGVAPAIGGSKAITGIPANAAPVANADAFSVFEDGATVSINVLANDTDADAGDTKTVVSVNGSLLQGSQVTIAANGLTVNYSILTAFQYLTAGEINTDTFSYTMADSKGAQSTAVVTVTVIGVNDAPLAVEDFESTRVTEDSGPVRIDVLRNDTDPDGDPFGSDTKTVVSVNTTGTLGSVSVIEAGGAVEYAVGNAFQHLTAGQSATDVFFYTMQDGSGVQSTARVEVTVIGADEPPPPGSIIGTNNSETLNGTNANDTIFGLFGDDVINSAGGADTLYGGPDRDTLDAGDGNDILTGNGDRDDLTGGAGADIFVFETPSDSTPLEFDTILDFSSAEGDKIDLRPIDADVFAAGNNAFVLSAAFTGVAGQLAFDALTNQWWGDVNGDAQADFAIEVQVVGGGVLSAGDFLL